jgi:tetratricopeptide (TPR) repeat protein
MADAFIAECETSPHYLEHMVRGTRSWIRLARGDVDGALEDVERSVEHASQAGDPQAIVPQLLQSAYIYTKLGRLDDARAAAGRALDAPNMKTMLGTLWLLAPVARELGMHERVCELLADAPGHDRPWMKVAIATAEGDFSGAADIFAARGAPSLEALARLTAAETLFAVGRAEEAEAELERAHAFYRTVGATGYLEHGTALPAPSDADGGLQESRA